MWGHASHGAWGLTDCLHEGEGGGSGAVVVSMLVVWRLTCSSCVARCP